MPTTTARRDEAPPPRPTIPEEPAITPRVLLFFLGLVLSLSVARGACVDPNWEELGDATTKTYVIHPAACGDKGSLAYVLGGSLKEIGDGWTVYINPYNWSCTPGNNCGYASRPSLSTVTGSGAGLVTWEVSPVHIGFSNFKIDSLFPSVKVRFATNVDTVRLSARPAPAFAVMVFNSVENITVRNLDITATTADASFFVDATSGYDHTALVVRSDVAINYHLDNISATGYASTVLFTPLTPGFACRMDGTVISASVTLSSPYNVSHDLAPGEVVVAWWMGGYDISIQTASLLSSNEVQLGNVSLAPGARHTNLTGYGISYYDSTETTKRDTGGFSGTTLTDNDIIAIIVLVLFLVLLLLWCCLKAKRRWAPGLPEPPHDKDM